MTTKHLDEICYHSRSDFISARCDSPIMRNSLFCEKHSYRNGELGGSPFARSQKRRKMRRDHLSRKRDQEWNNNPSFALGFDWGECARCGGDGHTKDECSGAHLNLYDIRWQHLKHLSQVRSPDRCRNCGEDGHISRDCEE